MAGKISGDRVYDPERYGAVGDGVTDDTPAFQLMMDAMPPDTAFAYSKRIARVELARRDYYLGSGPWRINKPLIVDGCGKGDVQNYGTRFMTASTFSAIIVDSISATQRDGHGTVINDIAVCYTGVNAAFDYALTPGHSAANGLFGVPFPRWRRNMPVMVGAVIRPAKLPNWYANIVAGSVPDFGWAYKCTRASGSYSAGATGATGNVEPTTWLDINPRSATGAAKAFTAAGATMTSNGHGYSNGQAVRLSTAGTLPTGLSINTTYWIVNTAANTFGLAATAGGAAINTSGGSGVHSVFTYIYIDITTPILDNNLEWTPFISCGIQVKAKCTLNRVQAYGFPSSQIEINCSTLYAQEPSALDPAGGWDYSNSNNARHFELTSQYGGGPGIFVLGYDANAMGFFGGVCDYNSSGVYDSGSFMNSYYNFHADGNEHHTFWSRNSAFRGCYTEGPNAAPVVKGTAVWDHGVCFGFSGADATQSWPSNNLGPWEPRTAVASTVAGWDLVKPTTLMGFHYFAVPGYVTENGKTITVAATTDLVTCIGHGRSNGDVVQILTSQALPGGIAALTDYHVGNATTDTFKLYTDVGLTNLVDITDQGSGYHQLTAHLNADAGTDIIGAPAHGHAIGARLRFVTSGTLPGGLSLATDYYVSSVSHTANQFRVCTDVALASLVDITSTGAGVHYARRPLETGGRVFTTVFGTDVCTAAAHGYSNGQVVRLRSTTTLPAPLQRYTSYYVGSVTADTFKLYSDAGLTAVVDLTDNGTGTHFIGIEPIWPAFSQNWSWDLRNGTQYYLDKYGHVSDGCVDWRAGYSSEISDGVLKSGSVIWNNEHKNRVYGDRFWPGGIVAGSKASFAFAAAASEDSNGQYRVGFVSGRKAYEFTYNDYAPRSPLALTGVGNANDDGSGGNLLLPRGYFLGDDAGGTYRRTLTGTAAPTSGTWVRGDRVINSAPAAAGTEGWVCVTGGTPGTWKTFGVIAA